MDPFALFFAILLFTVLGVLAGVGTGLMPGVHVNNVALLVYVSQTTISGAIVCAFGWASPSEADVALMMSTLILAMAVSHTFISFAPSVFLGAPDEATALSVLPGHRMLLKGRGYEAVLLTARGCLYGFVVSLAMVLPLRMLVGSPSNLYDKLRPVMAGLLVLVVTLLIFSEKERQVATGRMIVKAHDMAGVQVLSRRVARTGLAAWPDLKPGDEVRLEGKVAKTWRGGFLLIKGGRNVVVETNDDMDGLARKWVAVEGLAMPSTRVASSTERRLWALAVFVLSGLLGWVLLSTPGILAANWFPVPAIGSISPSMILFPLFTGLFGLSTMVMSGTSRESLPEQEVEITAKMEPWREGRAVACGTLAGAAVSWFPGVSGASATVISRYLAGGDDEEDDSDREFLVSIGAANAATAVFTLVALFVIMKGRSGASATVGALMSSSLSPWEPLSSFPLPLAALLLSSLIAAVMAYSLAVRLAKVFARGCSSIRYGLLVKGVIVVLLVMVTLVTGAIGLIVAGIATVFGILPQIIGVRRVHLMGSLIMPAIILLAS